MQEVISLIQAVGFPIVMCGWFMTKGAKVIKSNTEAVCKLSNSIDLFMIEAKR